MEENQLMQKPSQANLVGAVSSLFLMLYYLGVFFGLPYSRYFEWYFFTSFYANEFLGWIFYAIFIISLGILTLFLFQRKKRGLIIPFVGFFLTSGYYGYFLIWSKAPMMTIYGDLRRFWDAGGKEFPVFHVGVAWLFGVLASGIFIVVIIRVLSRSSDDIRKIWFLPGTFWAIGIIVVLLLGINSTLQSGTRAILIYIIMQSPPLILYCVIFFFTGYWLAYPNKNVATLVVSSSDMEKSTMKFCSHCGHEVLSEAVICPHCGCALEANMRRIADVPNIGLNVLSFLFPLLGLILYIVFQNETPNKANAIGKWALIGFAVSLMPVGLLLLCL